MIRQFQVRVEDIHDYADQPTPHIRLHIEVDTDAPRVTYIVRDSYCKAQLVASTEAMEGAPVPHMLSTPLKLLRDGSDAMPPDERTVSLHIGSRYRIEIQAHYDEGPDDTVSLDFRPSAKCAAEALEDK